MKWKRSVATMLAVILLVETVCQGVAVGATTVPTLSGEGNEVAAQEVVTDTSLETGQPQGGQVPPEAEQVPPLPDETPLPEENLPPDDMQPPEEETEPTIDQIQALLAAPRALWPTVDSVIPGLLGAGVSTYAGNDLVAQKVPQPDENAVFYENGKYEKVTNVATSNNNLITPEGVVLYTDTTQTVAATYNLVKQNYPNQLMVTEVAPDSTNIGDYDAYEYIELFNGSDQTLDLSRMKIVYNNGKQDYDYGGAPGKILAPHDTFVFGVCNWNITNKPGLAEFNKNWGVNIDEAHFYYNKEQSLANDAARTMRLYYDGTLLQTFSYAGNAATTEGYMYDQAYKGDGNYNVTPVKAKATPFSVNFTQGTESRTKQYSVTVNRPKTMDAYYQNLLNNVQVKSTLGLWETLAPVDPTGKLEFVSMKSGNSAIISDSGMAVNVGTNIPVTVSFKNKALTDLVVSEVMVRDAGSTSSASRFEYVEIYNPTSEAKILDGYTLTYNNGSADYDFALGTTARGKVVNPGETFVYGICHKNQTVPTLDQFNSTYGSNVPSGNFAIYSGASGLGYAGANRTLTLKRGQISTSVVSWSENMCVSVDTAIQVLPDSMGYWISKPNPGTLINGIFDVQKTYMISEVTNASSGMMQVVDQQVLNLSAAGLYAPKQIAFTDFTFEGAQYRPRLKLLNENDPAQYYNGSGYIYDVPENRETSLAVDVYDMTGVPLDNAAALIIRTIAPQGKGQIGEYDAYEFVEIYNGGTEDIPANTVTISYEYGGKNPLNIAGETGDIIPAKGIYVIALSSSLIDSKQLPSLADFNSIYGSNVQAENFRYYQSAEGLSNSAARTMKLLRNGTTVDYVKFQGQPGMDLINNAFAYGFAPNKSTARTAEGLLPVIPGMSVNDIGIAGSKHYPITVVPNPAIQSLKMDEDTFQNVTVKTSAVIGETLLSHGDLTQYNVATSSDKISVVDHAGIARGVGQAVLKVNIKPKNLNTLLISEVMVKPELTGDERYQYIEIYNGSSEVQTISSYELVYNNGTTDYVLPITSSVTVAPGEIYVYIICSRNAAAVTLADFNQFYGTALTISNAEIYTGILGLGTSNDAERTVTLRKKSDKSVASSVTYNAQLAANKRLSVNYYAPLSSLQLTAAPTPGSVINAIYGVSKSYQISVGNGYSVTVNGNGASLAGPSSSMANSTEDFSFYINLEEGYSMNTPGNVSYTVNNGSPKSLSNVAGLYTIARANITGNMIILVNTINKDYAQQAATIQSRFPEFAKIATPYAVMDESHLMGNYIPQGMGYSMAKNWLILGSYHQDNAAPGILTIIDNATKKTIKHVRVFNNDGSPAKDLHMGGLVANDVGIWITGEGSLYYIPISAIDAAADYGKVAIVERKMLYNSASFGSYSYTDNIFWVGEFGYTSGGYDVHTTHINGSNQGLLYGFDLAANATTIASKPKYVISLPQKVQGAAVGLNNQLYISISYGRNNKSTLGVIGDFTTLSTYQKTLDDGNSYTIYNIPSAFEKVTMPNLTQNLAYLPNENVMLVNNESPALKYRTEVGADGTQHLWAIAMNDVFAFTKHPQSQTKKVGASVTFTAALNNAPSDVRYQWMKNGVDIPGKTALTYTITGVQMSDGGSYTLKAISGDNQATSMEASLNIVDTGIHEFSFSGIDARAAITPSEGGGGTIKVLIPQSTGVQALVPVFRIDATSVATVGGVAQVSGTTAQNFGQPVIYTVGAQGLTDVWTVSVEKERTLSVTGTAKYGQTLTAVLTGGTYSYQWLRNGVAIADATSATYTLAEADVGAAISVQVSGDGIIETLTSTATAAIEKADGSTQKQTPSFESRTADSITLVPVAGAEYSKDGGLTWQDSNVFGGLQKGESCRLCLRIKETATHKAGVAGDILTAVVEDLVFNTFALKDIARNAAIDGAAHTIILEVPADTNVQSAVATFTVPNGVVVKVSDVTQISGVTTNNFDAVVTYTLSQSGQTPENWTIMVQKATAVKITGSTAVGSQLTASLTGGNTGDAHTYQWKSGDATIPNATQATYTLKQADMGKLLSVTVLIKNVDFLKDTSVTSPPVLIQEGTFSVEIASVRFDGGNADTTATVTLYAQDDEDNQTPLLVVENLKNGTTAELSGIKNGTYKAVVEVPNHGEVTIHSIVINGQSVALDIEVKLFVGDLTGDGSIDLTDMTELVKHIGGADLNYDLTGDGRVDFSDLTKLLKNFGLVSEDIDAQA